MNLTLPLPNSHLCENYLPLPISHLWEFITCMVENRQTEWSVTWAQCSLVFSIYATCACAYLLPVLCLGATSGVLLKKEVGFWG